MPENPENIFYELMWRTHGRGRRIPLPWWVQQYFRSWSDDYDHGLFESRQSAFSSNAHYRYWNMLGVKDHQQECLIGQSGEVEPVYDRYALSFFLFDPRSRQFAFPQYPDFSRAQPGLEQLWEQRYLPIHITRFRSQLNYSVDQKVLATTVGIDQKSLVLVRLSVRPLAPGASPVWLCVSVAPTGPTGFERHDRARMMQDHRWLPYLRYHAAESRLDVNRSLGPVFDSAPERFGMYGNGSSEDPDFYMTFNAYEDLRASARLNGFEIATDYIGGFCHGVLAWEVGSNGALDLDIRLPVDDFRGTGDMDVLRRAGADDLETNNRNYWTTKLDGSGFQCSLPVRVAHLFDLYRFCRATVLMLSDHGEIHPGPTIYDSFWVRDSSVEGVAAALAGDHDLAARQLGDHYTRPGIFHQDHERVGPNSRYGFFGGEHEQHDHEWDSNGQALWAFGRFDRIRGSGAGFGASIFSPYVLLGARWIRDNRSEFGLLRSGWSAEHVGDKDKPHYWDDFWAAAGLWEAAQLAERLHAPQRGELWSIYDEVRVATANSIHWVLEEQRRRGHWETFIPTGPGDVGRLDSTIIGAVAYFHPCRLHMGQKLGPEVDWAARMTLETVWGHFRDGEQDGFRHDAAWYCFGPYLTLQLAHAFLFVGDIERMDRCLAWSVGAAFAGTRHTAGAQTPWQAVLGAWNEQHCYPVAKDFRESPNRWWYMGDIPHGWAAAELMLLVRDILFFEADEDQDPHIFLAPGVPPHWLGDGERVEVRDAPTCFGGTFGYELHHDAAARRITIDIRQRPSDRVRYVYPCRFGSAIMTAQVDGVATTVHGRDVLIGPRATRTVVTYV